MQSYDAQHYDPPAPIARVTLRNTSTGATVTDVVLLIDTGAHLTLLPRNAVERVGLKPNPAMQYELIGFHGEQSTSSAVDLDMIFLQRAFRGRYLLIDEDRGDSRAGCSG